VTETSKRHWRKRHLRQSSDRSVFYHYHPQRHRKQEDNDSKRAVWVSWIREDGSYTRSTYDRLGVDDATDVTRRSAQYTTSGCRRHVPLWSALSPTIHAWADWRDDVTLMYVRPAGGVFRRKGYLIITILWRKSYSSTNFAFLHTITVYRKKSLQCLVI